ncbi:MAG: molybdopterin-dependent oxidoreductase, partial [Xanthobacteraceae bacterium]
MTIRKRRGGEASPLEPVAGNGLLNRRALLGSGIVLAGAAGVGSSVTGAAAEALKEDPWSLEMGAVVPAYQVPSRFEKDVIRTRSNPNNDFRNSHARTPHHMLQGTVTPNGLFFSISHSGLPDIDPAQHKLVIHGLVKQPLVYTVESLSRYPMVTRMHFVECSGNSAPMFSSEPMQVTAQALHGLCSNAEWTGVLLSTLLEETGIDPKAKWLLAEGADSLTLHRSVPVKKALDDAMIALYQN